MRLVTISSFIGFFVTCFSACVALALLVTESLSDDSTFIPYPPAGPPPSSDRFNTDSSAPLLAPPPSSDRFFTNERRNANSNHSGANDRVYHLESILRAYKFSLFLRTIRGDELICKAVRNLYNAKPDDSPCIGKQHSSKNTVIFSVTTTDRVAGTYELELIGLSTELALKSPHWVERHKFYVGLGFDANLEPQVVIVNHEPMIRTTGQLIPEQDELFEYITLLHDSELASLQEHIKSAISSYIQAAINRKDEQEFILSPF